MRVKRDHVFWGITGVCLVVLVSAIVFRDQLSLLLFRPTTSEIPVDERKIEQSSITRLANNLDTPWAFAFLPNGDMLVTERGGTLRELGENGTNHEIQGVTEVGEGGLLGVAVHPSFAINQEIYIYFTTKKDGVLTNQVDRYELSDQKLTNKKTIIDNIPAAANHDGGGIAFGPDDRLYITTGDAGQADQAQDTNSLAGKILRLNDDGSIPGDNPFHNAVWSYGHRNPQGITWDDQGRMWAVEHGPSGERNGTGKDELNRIEKGANYGWPVTSGDQTHEGMKSPVAQSGKETWAPSGIAYANGSLFFAGLRGESLYEARILDDNKVKLTRHFVQTYGRLRAVAVHDNYLYISTSNRDGRGKPATSDDTILQIDLRSAWREE